MPGHRKSLIYMFAKYNKIKCLQAGIRGKFKMGFLFLLGSSKRKWRCFNCLYFSLAIMKGKNAYGFAEQTACANKLF